MSEPKDMILPLLRDIRDEVRTRFNQVDMRLDKVDMRLDKIEAAQKSYRNALTADTMMSKMVIGDFEEHIVALEHQIEALVKAK